MSEHASQNELVWNGKPLHKSVQEFEIESDDLKINGYTVCDTYEIFSPVLNPETDYSTDDSEDREVTNQPFFFQRRHPLAKYPDDHKEDWPDLINIIYHFEGSDSSVYIQASKADWRKGQKSIEIYSNSATLEYNPETGELETVELPYKTGTPDDDDPLFYPRIKYSIKEKTYLGREDKPLKTNNSHPVSQTNGNKQRIIFNLDGAKQTLTVPVSIKVSEQDPFNQFTDLNSDDWVNPKLLETLRVFAIN